MFHSNREHLVTTKLSGHREGTSRNPDKIWHCLTLYCTGKYSSNFSWNEWGSTDFLQQSISVVLSFSGGQDSYKTSPKQLQQEFLCEKITRWKICSTKKTGVSFTWRIRTEMVLMCLRFQVPLCFILIMKHKEKQKRTRLRWNRNRHIIGISSVFHPGAIPVICSCIPQLHYSNVSLIGSALISRLPGKTII